MSAFVQISNYIPADLEVDLPLLMSKMKRRITQSTLRAGTRQVDDEGGAILGGKTSRENIGANSPFSIFSQM